MNDNDACFHKEVVTIFSTVLPLEDRDNKKHDASIRIVSLPEPTTFVAFSGVPWAPMKIGTQNKERLVSNDE